MYKIWKNFFYLFSQHLKVFFKNKKIKIGHIPKVCMLDDLSALWMECSVSLLILNIQVYFWLVNKYTNDFNTIVFTGQVEASFSIRVKLIQDCRILWLL